MHNKIIKLAETVQEDAVFKEEADNDLSLELASIFADLKLKKTPINMLFWIIYKKDENSFKKYVGKNGLSILASQSKAGKCYISQVIFCIYNENQGRVREKILATGLKTGAKGSINLKAYYTDVGCYLCFVNNGKEGNKYKIDFKSADRLGAMVRKGKANKDRVSRGKNRQVNFKKKSCSEKQIGGISKVGSNGYAKENNEYPDFIKEKIEKIKSLIEKKELSSVNKKQRIEIVMSMILQETRRMLYRHQQKVIAGVFKYYDITNNDLSMY